MEYFTSEVQEKAFEEKYKEEIRTKQKELDDIQKKTNKLQKFTAYAYVHKPERMFQVKNGKTYLDGEECPTELVSGGKRYLLDSTININDFFEKYSNYTVIFYPTSKYGPTVEYCAKKDIYPAKLIAPDGYEVIVEDESKYDLICA